MKQPPMFIKFLCANLLNSRWEESLEKLNITLSDFSFSLGTHDDVNEIHSFLRVVHVNNKAMKSDVIEKVYNIYCNIFKRKSDSVTTETLVEFLDDLSALVFLISNNVGDSSKPWSILSEECCLALVNAVYSLVLLVNKRSCTGFYCQNNLPIISHVFSVLLEMGEFASWRDVRIKALLTLALVPKFVDTRYSAEDITDFNNNSYRFMAQIFPGFSQTYYRIIIADEKLGSKVKEASFGAWSSLMVSIFNCCDLDFEHHCVDFHNESDTVPLFSSKWYSSTLSHLFSLISHTIDNVIHVQLELDVNKSRRLSSALINWLSTLVLKCNKISKYAEGEHILHTSVSGLLALAAHVTDTENSNNSRILEIIETFSQLEGNYELSEQTLPKCLLGTRLIRKISMDSVVEQVNILLNYMFTVCDESLLQKRFRSVYGYLHILDSNGISVFVCASDLLHRFCTALVQFLNFNTAPVAICDDDKHHSLTSIDYYNQTESSHNTRTLRPAINLFSKSFHHFRNQTTLVMIQSIAGKIASPNGAFDLFHDTCRDIMHQVDSEMRNACLLLIIAALNGYINNATIPWSERKRTGLDTLIYYFDSDLINLPLSLSHRQSEDNLSPDLTDQTIHNKWPFVSVKQLDESNSVLDVKQLKANTITVCLLLELFCTVTQLPKLTEVNSTDMHQAVIPVECHLSDYLHIGLKTVISLASRSGSVGHCARVCLEQVAKNCGFKTVNELVTSNAEYLISIITLDLHRVNLLAPCQPSELLCNEAVQSLISASASASTLFELVTIDALSVIKPMVTQMLSSLDLTYEHWTHLFLTPLYQLVQTCHRWMKLHYPSGSENDEHDSSVYEDDSESVSNVTCITLADILTKTYQNSLKLIKETRQQHSSSSLCYNNCDNETLETGDACGDDATCAVEDKLHNSTFPEYLQVVEEVMLRCIHLTASSDPKLRILCLRILKEGCLTMADESELLLPIVHKIWASLMSRFRDSNACVVEQAFDLFTVLSKVAGQFLRSRASSDIIPPLTKFLEQGHSISASATESYTYLTAYRVQKKLLTQIGILCSQLNLSPESLRMVIRILILYLDETQPIGLQQASLISLQRLWSLDPGGTWTILVSHFPSSDHPTIYMNPDISIFKPIEMHNKFAKPLDNIHVSDKIMLIRKIQYGH